MRVREREKERRRTHRERETDVGGEREQRTDRPALFDRHGFCPDGGQKSHFSGSHSIDADPGTPAGKEMFCLAVGRKGRAGERVGVAQGGGKGTGVCCLALGDVNWKRG